MADSKRSERIKHIFQFMEYDHLSEKQHDLVIKFEDWFNSRKDLSDEQLRVLESIFKQASERSERYQVNYDDD